MGETGKQWTATNGGSQSSLAFPGKCSEKDAVRSKQKEVQTMASKGPEHEELYTTLGKFVIAFTEVEQWLISLLGVLTDAHENIWIQPIFIDEMMTGRVRAAIEFGGKIRLEDNEDLHKRLKQSLQKAETITTERNKMVHGKWNIDLTGRSPTKLWNFKLKKQKAKDGCGFWEHLHETTVTGTMLVELTKESEQVAVELQQLNEDIETFLKAEAERVDRLVRAAGSGMMPENT